MEVTLYQGYHLDSGFKNTIDSNVQIMSKFPHAVSTSCLPGKDTEFSVYESFPVPRTFRVAIIHQIPHFRGEGVDNWSFSPCILWHSLTWSTLGREYSEPVCSLRDDSVPLGTGAQILPFWDGEQSGNTGWWCRQEIVELINV